jgi:hypothetical protein
MENIHLTKRYMILYRIKIIVFVESRTQAQVSVQLSRVYDGDESEEQSYDTPEDTVSALNAQTFRFFRLTFFSSQYWNQRQSLHMAFSQKQWGNVCFQMH